MNIHEETLKIARNLIKKDPSLTDWVISKFPELAESEDEKIINKLIAVVELYYGIGDDLDKQMCLSWLKSIRPYNHWKPSDEQMNALHDLNLTGNISYAGQGQVLIELYNDLKKLKE